MAEAQLRHIRIADLDRRHNVRRSLGDLSDLVESIRDVGVLTLVTVMPKASASGWRLVAAHRRTAAAEEAGLETVPALVHTAEGAEERLLATLVENLQRLDLNPVEEAGGYRSLVDAGWSQAEVARRVRRSRGHVSRRLRILTLPDEVQEMVAEGTVTVEHAYTLSRLVAKGVDADDVVVAADTAPEYAATRLLEIETAERREHRRRKLERGGIKVVLANRLHPSGDKYDRLVAWLRLDGDHSAEPCHVVILHYNDYGRTTIGEDAVCTDRSRHDADGGPSGNRRGAPQAGGTRRRARGEAGGTAGGGGSAAPTPDRPAADTPRRGSDRRGAPPGRTRCAPEVPQRRPAAAGTRGCRGPGRVVDVPSAGHRQRPPGRSGTGGAPVVADPDREGLLPQQADDAPDHRSGRGPAPSSPTRTIRTTLRW